MKKEKFFTRTVLSIGLAAAAAGLTPVYAEDTTVPVQGGTAVFEKYLVMDEDANVPAATFNFTITSGTAVAGTEIKAGIFKDATTSITATAQFTTDMDTYDDVQDLPQTVTVRKEDKEGTINKDKVSISAGQKYARTDVSVNFSGVTYREPGIYRYIVTEAGENKAPYTNDAKTTRLLDVYVGYKTNSDELQIEGYVLHNNENGEADENSEKSKGFTNMYTTHNLTLKKEVTGNQASHSEYFQFTVKINGKAGTVYDVDLGDADANIDANVIDNEAHTNPAQLTCGDEGSVTQVYWLKGGQSIVIKGIEDSAGYEIEEDKSAAEKGYQISAAVTGDDISENTTTQKNPAVYRITDSAMKADAAVTYTNLKTGDVPTGVMMSVLPGALVCLAGGTGAFVLMMNKKKKREE